MKREKEKKESDIKLRHMIDYVIHGVTSIYREKNSEYRQETEDIDR